MSVVINASVSGVEGAAQPSWVNPLVAGGLLSATPASPSLDFSNSINSMYIFPMTGIGVN